jgi:excisionase family DNA binding protein
LKGSERKSIWDGIMSADHIVDFETRVKPSPRNSGISAFKGDRKRPPQRTAVAPEHKLLVSREEAAQLLSISQRALDYLVAAKRLPVRRIGGRVLLPVADLRKYARSDHPERIVS